ncbi:hypothetical protein SBA1_250002 [Candidatus Sulfotelmatobacter kueseliae]|uniref:Uncharacterized protein n=1 Tax=Candidatus Sulfotelmatobacter kueseliae TaxID=2042962 RepID=A0A2U3KHQ0_9BACT|nr:hypothetical protein SBA1_250002 [Candidatus Sulfotelmatobacter kueseliae]
MRGKGGTIPKMGSLRPMWSGHSCPLPLSLFDEGTTPSADGTNGKGTTSSHAVKAHQESGAGPPFRVISTPEDAPSLSLRFLQGQGGDFDLDEQSRHDFHLLPLARRQLRTRFRQRLQHRHSWRELRRKSNSPPSRKEREKDGAAPVLVVQTVGRLPEGASLAPKAKAPSITRGFQVLDDCPPNTINDRSVTRLVRQLWHVGHALGFVSSLTGLGCSFRELTQLARPPYPQQTRIGWGTT